MDEKLKNHWLSHPQPQEGWGSQITLGLQKTDLSLQAQESKLAHKLRMAKWISFYQQEATSQTRNLRYICTTTKVGYIIRHIRLSRWSRLEIT